METTPRVHFMLPTAAGRPVGREALVFTWEEIQAGKVDRVGVAMVLHSGMGNLFLGFEVPGDESLASDPVFRGFAKKLIRSIPSPFYSLSLESDALKLLFLATLDNLEVQWRASDEQVSICADSGEYSVLFAEEVARLRSILNANGGMEEFEERMREIGEYFAR